VPLRLWDDDPILKFWKWLSPLSVGEFNEFHEMTQDYNNRIGIFQEDAFFIEKWEQEDGTTCAGMQNKDTKEKHGIVRICELGPEGVENE
jgi:hypothetical protein